MFTRSEIKQHNVRMSDTFFFSSYIIFNEEERSRIFFFSITSLNCIHLIFIISRIKQKKRERATCQLISRENISKKYLIKTIAQIDSIVKSTILIYE